MCVRSSGVLPSATQADAVALHDAAGRGGQQQQVQVLWVRRGAGDPAPGQPVLGGGLPGLGVRPLVILLDDEPLERGVELLQGEPGWGDGLAAGAVRDVPGQVR